MKGVVDPRMRKRQDSVIVRAQLSKTLSNAELFGAFGRAIQGKMDPTDVIPHYLSHMKDILAYMQDEDGNELPVSLWTKETIWEYIHYVEANYCRSLRIINSPWARGVVCTKQVWSATLPAEEATRDHCGGCKIFESSTTGVEKRLQSIVKFFKFLTRTGVVETNFMRDILAEWREDQSRSTRRELRRNPSIAEVVKLVNGTTHPRNRAFYASSSKWWLRPNEMLMLDRYASFGLEPPAGGPVSQGFARGFAANPEVRSLDDAGGLAYVPETKKFDKRKGNRWLVIDAELSPLLEQYFSWWERRVQRDSTGRPVTTALWLSEHGLALKQDDLYRSLFYADCQRLGLMTKLDERDPMRRWTAHCQRHFGEKLCMTHNVPDLWAKHFRGDVIKDARGHYFIPGPLQIRDAYLEHVPTLGFYPLADVDASALLGNPDMQREIHRQKLREGLARVGAWRGASEPTVPARLVEVDGDIERELAIVPRRYAHALAAAMGPKVLVEPDTQPRRNMRRADLLEIFACALAKLDG